MAASAAATVGGRKRAGRSVAKDARPTERRGTASSGHIVKLLVGQSHGFIRLADKRDIYFHRCHLEEGTPFNDFAAGDAVTVELLEDDVSAARAAGQTAAVTLNPVSLRRPALLRSGQAGHVGFVELTDGHSVRSGR